MYDLIVIGGGPGGYMAAERAGQAGLSVLLIEKRALGGVCLNEGCIPSKTLLHSAKIYDAARHGGAYGVSVSGAAIDHGAVVARKNKVVGTLVRGVEAAMRASKVTVAYGEAFCLDRSHVRVDGQVYEGRRLLIATGSVPVIPPIEGVGEGIRRRFALTSREILDLGEVPRNLVVVGAGAIGLEMASYFHSAGSKVTVVEMLSHIAGTADAEVSVGLMRAYEEKGVEFQCGVRVTAMGVDSVTTETGQIPADRVLLSVGRRPVIDGFGLENIGAAVSRGAVVTDRHGMTSVPDVYAVGDVNGKYMLAHVAYREAEVAVNHMLGKRDVMRYDAVPSVVYTSPEAAWAGETEESARARGIDCACVSLPMAYSGRYVAENERSGGTSGTGGIAKVVVDRKHNNVIGVHLLGPYASEIIVSACAMIEMQMRVDDVKELIFPHPTVSEMIREVIHKM